MGQGAGWVGGWQRRHTCLRIVGRLPGLLVAMAGAVAAAAGTWLTAAAAAAAGSLQGWLQWAPGHAHALLDAYALLDRLMLCALLSTRLPCVRLVPPQAAATTTTWPSRATAAGPWWRCVPAGPPRVASRAMRACRGARLPCPGQLPCAQHNAHTACCSASALSHPLPNTALSIVMPGQLQGWRKASEMHLYDNEAAASA